MLEPFRGEQKIDVSGDQFVDRVVRFYPRQTEVKTLEAKRELGVIDTHEF
jgi:hypothetical protein